MVKPRRCGAGASSSVKAAVKSDKVKRFTLYFSRLVNIFYPVKTTISSKGQITVPRVVRKALGLSPGTRLEVKLRSPGGFLVTKSAIEDFFGRFKGVARRRARWHSGDEAVAALRDAGP